MFTVARIKQKTDGVWENNIIVTAWTGWWGVGMNEQSNPIKVTVISQHENSGILSALAQH